jgi:uncharacterized protein
MADKGRGFAAMDQAKQREIASRGGRAAHKRGTAHQFTTEEAAKAGRKGGQSVSRNREHMAKIGRKGGLATHHRNAAMHPNGTERPEEARQAELTQTAGQPQDQRELPRETPIFHEPNPATPRAESDWDSEELLDEGRMGNENATEERTGGSAGGGRFEQEGAAERQGGHGYGSFEEEGSPQIHKG